MPDSTAPRGGRGVGGAGPSLAEVAALAAAIGLPCEPADIDTELKEIRRGIARSHGDPVVLRREFGNLIVSGLRWAAAYGLDPAQCIAAAEDAQHAHAARLRGDTP